MFGGIVEAIGLIKHIHHDADSRHFIITPTIPFHDVKIGDSISVNGVCLTVTVISNESLHFTAVPETLQLTNLKHLACNDEVNLERALTASHRIGGHQVQGHVDTTATITAIESTGEHSFNATFAIDSHWSKYIVHKGFITIDGMSITITHKKSDSFSVTFIPHTVQQTVTKHYRVGHQVNIEVDVLGKYIEQYIGAYLDEQQLRTR